MRVTKIDPSEHKAWTEEGQVIGYGKVLIATGGKPRNLPILEKADPEVPALPPPPLPLNGQGRRCDLQVRQHLTLFRRIPDFQELDAISRKVHPPPAIRPSFLLS